MIAALSEYTRRYEVEVQDGDVVRLVLFLDAITDPNNQRAHTSWVTIHSVNDDQPSSGERKQDRQSDPKSGDIAQPIPPNAPSPPQTQGITDEQVDNDVKELENRVKKGEIWMICLTGALVFVGLCQVGAALLQWNSMNKQLSEMQSGGGDTHYLALAAGWQANRMQDFANRMKDQADNTEKLVTEAKISAEAAKSASETASNQLVLSERPWIKIKHRIISPLTFEVGGRASGNTVALMKVEDTIENVGQSVAVNVLSWEDVIPIDADHSIKTARARQKEYCDANRHPDPHSMAGYSIFPHDPSIQTSVIGPEMSKVKAATVRNDPGLDGKVGFVLVGCVFYRSTFESANKPTHQTRFIYWLGISGGQTFMPYIVPNGVADQLRLIEIPDGFSAD